MLKKIGEWALQTAHIAIALIWAINGVMVLAEGVKRYSVEPFIYSAIAMLAFALSIYFVRTFIRLMFPAPLEKRTALAPGVPLYDIHGVEWKIASIHIGASAFLFCDNEQGERMKVSLEDIGKTYFATKEEAVKAAKNINKGEHI